MLLNLVNAPSLIAVYDSLRYSEHVPEQSHSPVLLIFYHIIAYLVNRLNEKGGITWRN